MRLMPRSRQGWLRLLAFPFAAYLLIAPVAAFLGALPAASKLNGVPTYVVHGTEAHLNYGLMAVGLAGYVTIISAFVCVIRLYRYAGRVTKPVPGVSILIIGATVLISGLALFFPQILFAFWRSPAFWTGEWWRLVTPLFVQSEGWGQYVYNVLTALFLLPLAEKFYGKRLSVLYFVSGILGSEVFFYAFYPDTNGAGSSVANYGVMGGLFVFAFRHRQELSRSTVVFVISGLCPSFFLSFRQDVHGNGMLLGALLACLMRSRVDTVPEAPPDMRGTMGTSLSPPAL